MKNKINYFSIIFLIMSSIVFFTACKKDKPIDPNEDPNENPNDTTAVVDDYYGMQMLDISTELPHQVNILFRVYDNDEVGVSGLTTSKFTVYENDHAMGSEASATIAPFGDIPYEIKTVLLLDVSVSVEANLSQIKDAASALVNNMTDYQQIAVYTFSSNPELIQDFSSDKTQLINAINSIELGTSSTNLYGSIITAAGRIVNSYTTTEIKDGTLVVLTDGDDTQGSSTLDDALSAVSGKNVYMLGLGAEMDESIMEQLGKFYKAENISDLEGVFLDIQNKIEQTAKSVYWLYYQSPKRGDNEHELKLEIIDNKNTGSDKNIIGYFNSVDFVDPTGDAPESPSNPNPENNASESSFSSLSWDCSDPDGDPLTYDVYFGTTSNPPRVSTKQSSRSYLISTDEETTYYWKIVAFDNNYNSTSSTVWTFTTLANQAPVISNPSPENNATGGFSELSWDCSDAEGDPITYDIYFGTSSNPPLVASARTSRTYSISTDYATTYYWKIVAKDNASNETTSSVWAFTTLANQAPTVPSNPSPENNATDYSFSTLSWDCSDPNGDPVTYDIYFGTSSNPPLVASSQTETSYSINTDFNNTYYWKIVAKDNSSNETISPIWSFTTLDNTLTDIDGNTYHFVTIGSQTWMSENLRVTHYPNGTAIPNISDNTAWGDLEDNNTDDAYCYYDNSTSNGNIYGALYTWSAAMGDNAVSSTTNPSGVQGVCPTGWHLPSDAEWTELTYYLGGESVAGGKLKEAGTVHWDSPNEGATNESGFSALPGGYRYGVDGTFNILGGYCGWWSSTEYSSTNAYNLALSYGYTKVFRSDYIKTNGFSVRCVRD